MPERDSTDKAPLSVRNGSVERSDEDVTAGIARMIRALGRRCAEADPDTAALLRLLVDELDDAIAGAVAGWRSTGFSDAQIGRELGVTKQAVQQRWPRRPSQLP
jgi:hypothetical protein